MTQIMMCHPPVQLVLVHVGFYGFKPMVKPKHVGGLSMKSPRVRLLVLLFLMTLPVLACAAATVPTEIQLPGTQPGEVSNFESPNKCDNCHAGYNDADTAAAGTGEPQDEPGTGWRGAGMGNAGRDPIFWATMAIAEQDFDGSGDLCIRCHSTGGWYGGRSTPTDASGLAASDSDGVDCDTCHAMTNPDNSEYVGVMNSPFNANCSVDLLVPDKNCDTTTEGFYGSGMASMWAGSDKLGPYTDADARHQFLPSDFHRSVDFCGTCHDVSNSAVGDLAPNHGAQAGAPAVVSSYGSDCDGDGDPETGPCLGGAVEDKAAFNNPPYAYGVVERTFSEYKASAFPTTRVSDFNNLPVDLRVAEGSIETTYQAALLAGNGGDYADGAVRFFSCQSCHMRPTNSAGANKNGVQIRPDLPQHDHTGGNYWLADMIKYQDARDQLRLGGGLTITQISAIDLGQLRAVEHLRQAASLQVDGNTLKVVNLTGHKLISGYPEGRRMWLNIKWFDSQDTLIREDGAYGPLVDDDGNAIMVANPAGGPDVQVESLLELDDDHGLIYEAHYAMTQEWAALLIATGKSPDLVLNYERDSGEADHTLGELAAEEPGSYEETFHFALNNYVSYDNRIPPYGMRYDEARKRNTLPVPNDQYGSPSAGGVYNYWDEFDLNLLRPGNAVSADVTLYYQGTSWEYIQFLKEANNGTDPAQGGNAFLGAEGVNMLEAWINAEVPVAIEVGGDRKMVPPVVMATVSWGSTPTTVGGSVSGLSGSGLVLQNNGGDDLGISVNGDFTFATALASGETYNVTVLVQPSSPNQVCSVTNGSGTMANADVTDVSVSCVTNTYTIGGNVNGLSGSGLVLQNNSDDDLEVAADGDFEFAMPLNDGSQYDVTVLTHPSDQNCEITGGSGTLNGENVSTVRVVCAIVPGDTIFSDSFE